MIKPNFVQKVFTFDIFPEDGEVGNALWGYEIANNLNRLFVPQYTHFFQITQPTTGEGTVHTALIDISRYQLHAAPIVQSWGVVPPYSYEFILNPEWVSHELSGDYLKVNCHLIRGAQYNGYVATVVTRLFGA